MPICPNCQKTYVESTDHCDVCKVSLMDSLPREDGAADRVDLVELACFSNVSEAEMIREILEANGIPTIQRGEVDPIGIASRAEPITLLVEERRLLSAREIYEAFFAGEGIAPTEYEPG